MTPPRDANMNDGSNYYVTASLLNVDQFNHSACGNISMKKQREVARMTRGRKWNASECETSAPRQRDCFKHKFHFSLNISTAERFER